MRNGERALVLITVDCLRADHCGFHGYSRPTTPFLDSLAPESFVLPAAIVGGAPTYYSFPTIFASRMPLALGRDVVGLAPGENTLATVLRESGYATAAFSAGNPYISPRSGYEQGFEVFRDFLERDFLGREFANVDSFNIDFLNSEPQLDQGGGTSDASSGNSVRGKLNQSVKSLATALGLGQLYNDLYFRYRMKNASAVESIDALRKFPAADFMVDQAEAWLASVGERPFLLWLHLMDPHSPYYPVQEAFREMTGSSIESGRARYLNEYWNRSDLTASSLREKRDAVVQLYDAGIRWVDRQIGRLVQILEQMELWDHCVLAVTADHGEEFLEHGGRYHAPVRLTEEIVRVPLLIRVPGERSGGIATSPMSHLHLAPTLLEILGEQAPPAFQGRSLWTHLRRGTRWDDAAISECAYGCTNPFRVEDRSAPRMLAVRDERFKLIMRMEPGAVEELYDLGKDPAETGSDGEACGDGVRKRLLLAVREHMEKAVSGRDGELLQRTRLRARLRDIRSQILG